MALQTQLLDKKQTPHKKRKNDELSSTLGSLKQNKQKQKHPSAFYALEPMVKLGAKDEKKEESKLYTNSGAGVKQPEIEKKNIPILSAQGKGKSHQHSVYGRSSVQLQGRTVANFDSSFHTTRVKTQAGIDCKGCSGRNCIHVSGTLVATYTVRTRVTLPSVSDFPDLTPCQRVRVQNAINTVLAPHEQEHVQAFNQYNGTTRTPFDMTLCKSEFNSSIQSMFESEESTRQSAAQAASDALDPFNFNVDINCKEKGVSSSSK